ASALYPLSLHDALPISGAVVQGFGVGSPGFCQLVGLGGCLDWLAGAGQSVGPGQAEIGGGGAVVQCEGAVPTADDGSSAAATLRSEEHTSELQSQSNLV